MLKLAINEREWIEKITQGDESAFKIMYEIYRDRLYTFCFKITKSEEASLEIVHDVFLKIWMKRETLDPEQSFNSLLFTITKNFALNFLKKAAVDKALKQGLAHFIEQTDNSTENQLVYSDYEAHLEKAIKKLPPQQQLVYTMSRIQGLSHAEIAESLHLSKGTVKKYIMLAVAQVSRFLNLNTSRFFFLLVILGELQNL